MRCRWRSRPPWARASAVREESPLGHVIAERQLQHDTIAGEFRRERRKRMRGVDAGHRGALQCRNGMQHDHQLRHAAVLVDHELGFHFAAQTQPGALRIDREPVPPDGGQDLQQVGLEIDALGIAEQFERAGLAARRRRQVQAAADPADADSLVSSPTVIPPWRAAMRRASRMAPARMYRSADPAPPPEGGGAVGVSNASFGFSCSWIWGGMAWRRRAHGQAAGRLRIAIPGLQSAAAPAMARAEAAAVLAILAWGRVVEGGELRSLNLGVRPQRLHRDFLGDRALVGRFLGQFRGRLDQRSDLLAGRRGGCIRLRGTRHSATIAATCAATESTRAERTRQRSCPQLVNRCNSAGSSTEERTRVSIRLPTTSRLSPSVP